MIDDPDVGIEYLALQVVLIQMVRPPIEHEKQVAALELAYGNLACSSTRSPSRSMFRSIALERYRWTDDEFSSWADESFREKWQP